jgi:hypothetical protein
MFPYTGVPWLAVLLAALIPMVVGFLWYGPILGKQWMALVNRRAEDMQSPNPIIYLISFLAWLVASYVLALILYAAGVDSPLDGAIGGLIVGLGINGAASLVQHQFDSRPFALWLLNTGYNVVSFVLMGALIASWGVG